MKFRKKHEEDESEILNWNAGSEFNQVIQQLKQEFIIADMSGDYITSLKILANEFDLSYMKIYCEALKTGKKDDVETKAAIIRKDIKNLKTLVYKKAVRSKLKFIDDKISNIRQNIWDMQGRYGVLFPFSAKEETKEGKPMAFVNQR